MKHNIRLIALYYEGDNVGSALQLNTSVLGVNRQYNWTLYPNHAISPDAEIYEVEASGSLTKLVTINMQASSPNSPVLSSDSGSFTLSAVPSVQTVPLNFVIEDENPKNATIHLTFAYWQGDPKPRDYFKEFDSISRCICSISVIESLLNEEGNPSSLSLYQDLNGTALQDLFIAANDLAYHLNFGEQVIYYSGSTPCLNTGALLGLIGFISENQQRITNSTLLTDFIAAFDDYKNIFQQLQSVLSLANLNPCGDNTADPWPGIQEIGENFQPTASCICKIFDEYPNLSSANQSMADTLEQHLDDYFLLLQGFLNSKSIDYNLSENTPCSKAGDIARMLGIIAEEYTSWNVTPGDFEALVYPLRNINDIFRELTFALPNICEGNAPPSVDLSSAVIQSPYIYLQACGSDNTSQTAGIIEGIHLRWALLKELGDNHLPKGTLANSGSSYYTDIAYNKDNDFVKIYKTQYSDPVIIELDFSLDVPQNIYTNDGRVWEIYKTTLHSSGNYNNTVIIRFLNEALYDSIVYSPLTSTLDFIKAYAGPMEIEVEGKLMFASEFEIQKSNNDPATLQYEVIRQPDPSEPDSLQITTRNLLSGDPISHRQVGENIKYFRVQYTGGFPSLISLETYEDFLRSRTSWTSVGDFGLTLTDTDATTRLDCNSSTSIDNSWPRFNDGVKTQLANYENKWNDPYGIKYGVTQYLQNSITDTKATVILDSQTTGDTSKIEISYLDYLNLASIDYHIARMLGLAHIDIFDNQNNKYVYIAVYHTAPEMLENRYFQPSEMRDHLYMSLPTDKQDYRVPPQPQIKPVTYGFDEMDEDIEATLLKPGGYGKFDKLRYINIYRNKYDYEIGFEDFFDNSIPFDISEIPTSILYGIEYKETSESSYRSPEITNDGEYQDFGPSGTSQLINETIPVPDNKGKLFTHEETEEGVHKYAIYGINWFYRTSQASAETATDTTEFSGYFTIKPPHNLNGHYIQKEENLLFTTTAEQTELAARETANPGGDNSFTRLTFEWNHIQRIAYQMANKLEFYFRSSLPNIIQGQIESTQSVSGGTEINIFTKPFALNSQDVSASVSPVISSGDYPKYIGSWFITEEERFIIIDITTGTNGPTFKVQPVHQPSKINDPTGASRFRSSPKKLLPVAGLRFQVVENLANESNWVKLTKTIDLVSHSNHSEVEVISGKNVTQHIGGIYSTATIITDPGTTPVNGLYKITFDTATLTDHPQKVAEKVTWYKGTARISNGTEMKVLEVWAIESQSPLIIWAYDPDYASNPITTGASVDVNFHPGYKVYLDNEPTNDFDKDTLLPAAGIITKESIIAVRAIDDTLAVTEKSNISVPATLIGINKREPVKPQKPAGPAFATRPDTFGKSSYTFDIDITSGDPFSLAFYRASDFEILAAIYEPEDIVQIYEDIDALTTNQFNFERFSDLANVLFDDTPGHEGEFKEYDGYRLPNTFKADVITGATTVEEIMAALKFAINNAFTPLTEQPVVYSFVKQPVGIIQTLNIPPKIRNEKGQLLNSDDIAFNPYPNAVRFTESTINKLRFTDYSLDGAAQGTYFYFAREISREMIIGERSDVAGPVRLINAFPADAPYIRKVETVLADPLSEISAGVRFYINPYHADQNVKKVAIYRTTDIDNAASLQLMQKAAEVEITSYLNGFTDVFADLDFPLFGETIYYRLVALRSIVNEQDLEEFIPSQPSNMVEGRVVDNINPSAPDLSFLVTNFLSSPPRLADIELSWEPTTYNAKYYLYKITSSGNWQKVYEVASNQAMTYTVTELDTVDDDGDTIYHRYKVDVENANGLLNLNEKPVVISGPAWPTSGLKMLYWDGSSSSYPGTGNTIYDLSGNSQNGSLQNFASPGDSTSGYYNGIFNYDGINDHIIFNNSWLDTKTEFSMYTIFKVGDPPPPFTVGGFAPGILGPNSGGSYFILNMIYGAGTPLSATLFLQGTSTNFYSTAHTGNVNPIIINDLTKFHHFVFTVKQGEICTYVNGILCHKQTISIGSLITPFLRIGRYGSTQYWKGQIPTTMGYDRAIAEQEVVQIYDYFKAIYE